ncbi:chromosome-associated kinesin KIF4A-like [Amblyomma americanum]
MGIRCSKNADDEGIIPRAIGDIFKNMTTTTGKSFLVRVSFLEIYQEQIFDLLSNSRGRVPLAIREDKTGTVKVPNLTQHKVATADETLRLVGIGSASRITAATNMNICSSRSHAILTLTVEQQNESGGATTVAKMNFVDLAGSERAEKTKAIGERFKEGMKINHGLLSLGNVVSSLSERKFHVPYRNSKLTRLLQDSLGGSSHTVMIACISPASGNREDTLDTLRYADRARKIKNKPTANIDPTQAEIANLRQKLQEAEAALMRCTTHEVQNPIASGGAEDAELLKDKLELALAHNAQLETENRRLAAKLQQAQDQARKQSEQVISPMEKTVSKLGEEHAPAECMSRIKELEAKVQRLERGFERKILEVKKELQELSLFKHSANSTTESHQDICASLVEGLEGQAQEIYKLQNAQDEPKKKTE